ncbi:MAG: hypothetical protein WAO19_08340 [Candidatus Kryptoniota bacterium]
MNTGAFKAVIIGIKRSIRNWRLWIGVYGFNIVFAAVLTLPVAAIFAKDVSRRLAGKDLMNGFNYKWYVDFINVNGGLFKSLLPQMVFVLALYFFIESFFAGGFYSTFSSKGRIKFGEFLAKGSTHFFPLFAVTTMEVTLLFLAYIGINFELSTRPFISDTWYLLFAAAPFIVINLFSDFVRAAVVIDNDNFWQKVTRGLSFTVLHPLSTTGVYLSGMLIVVAVIALYFLFDFVNDSTTSTGVFIEVVVAQIFILLRIFSKLIFYAGEATLYKENQIEVIKVKPEMLE